LNTQEPIQGEDRVPSPPVIDVELGVSNSRDTPAVRVTGSMIGFHGDGKYNFTYLALGTPGQIAVYVPMSLKCLLAFREGLNMAIEHELSRIPKDNTEMVS
jgi:hypothetical protein